jgi:predicted O-linked N-acetylglucosamine transferase (SPINDLY family)
VIHFSIDNRILRAFRTLIGCKETPTRTVWPFRKKADSAEALKSLGNARKARGDVAGAIASYRRSLEVSPDYLSALYNLGLILHETFKLDEAERCFRRVVELDPIDADALFHLGSLLHKRSELQEAAQMYRRALQRTPENPHLWIALGAALGELPGEAEESVRCQREARRCLEQAIERDPRSPHERNALGDVLQREGRVDEAIEQYRASIAFSPDHAGGHNNLGCALVLKGELAEAVERLREAVRLQPDFADAHFNLASAHSLAGRRDDAVRSFEAAERLRPDYAPYKSALLFEMQHTCDWSRMRELCEAQRRGIVERPAHPISPFSLLSIPSTLAEQLQCAGEYSRQISAAVAVERQRLDFRFDRAGGARLSVGYLSADFHEHATAYLAAELFELHDRGRFRLVGYSYGPDDGSPMRARLQRAFERFVDLEALPHADAAAAIHADSIDILVDLKGYTTNTRSEILALRPAPIQVSYLGYPGTMGADFIDYLVGDRFVTPPEHAEGYSEKLVLMPGSYQVNDRKRAVTEAPSRRELGLPEDAFVFCCFNQAYKILPEVFSIWTRLLQAMPGSVLWLLDWNTWATQNLRREALERGIDAGRLIFGPRLPLDAHLARLGAADLFLDTLPYNAHTMGSDALWVGVPIVTCAGGTFASRVAGSLLTAVGLPELIAGSLEEYEALALRLARSPGALSLLRDKLRRQRASAPLFDTPRFVRGLEEAYESMWLNYRRGDAPRMIEL